MPIIKSAKKRVKQAKKAAIRNSKTKRSMKNSLKIFKESLVSQSKSLKKDQSTAQSNIDKATKKHVIHKNKANRLKSRLAKQAKNSQTAKKATPTKKTVTKTKTKKKD
jgi:small subunit ribosomal protein S20